MGVLHVDRLHWWLHTLELLEYKTAKSERTENKTGETLVVLLLAHSKTHLVSKTWIPFENMGITLNSFPLGGDDVDDDTEMRAKRARHMRAHMRTNIAVAHT